MHPRRALFGTILALAAGGSLAVAGIDGTTSTTVVDGSTSTTLVDGSTSTTLIDTSTTVTSVSLTSTSLVSTSTTLDGGATTTTTLPGTTAAHDALFVTQASLMNLDEIESGGLASQAGQHPDVQAYGATMVTDHCAHLLELESAADAAGIPTPRALDVTPCDDKSPNGAFVTPSRDFDLTYARGQVTGHRRALDLYKRQARFGADQGLVTLADATVPLLKDHLRQAKRLVRAVRRGSANGTPTTTLPPQNGPTDDGS